MNEKRNLSPVDPPSHAETPSTWSPRGTTVATTSIARSPPTPCGLGSVSYSTTPLFPLRSRGCQVSIDLDQVSIKLDQVSIELDQVSIKLDQVPIKLDQVSIKLGQVSILLDQISIKVDQVFIKWINFL